MTLAFYLRLSRADGDMGDDNKDESNSIENQRMLLQEFVDSREDLNGEIMEYVDDGYTGTNFNRPGFARMIEDAKTDKINVILVKDLSRLGRDYISVGDYLEQVFPVLGIRFIAVNSNYDSDNYIGDTMGLDLGITNLVNTLYSRDLSKKLRSAEKTKWKQGISTNGRIPYGYKKDPEHKGKWIIDPVAGKYVRTIFDKALAGWNTKMISNYLNEQNIPTPGQYRELHNEDVCYRHKVKDEERMWDTEKVWAILRKYAYTGALVQGKTQGVTIVNRSRRIVKPSDWTVVENVNEPIVSKEEFIDAQSVIRNVNMPAVRQDQGFSLRGKVRCGNCNLCMSYIDCGTPIIQCAHATIAGVKSKCSKTEYSAVWIESVVLSALQNQLELLNLLECQIEDKKEQTDIDLTKERKREGKELEILQAEQVRQYESYADGVISKEKYLSRKTELNRKIESLQDSYEKICSLTKEGDDLLDEIGTLQDEAEETMIFQKLTRNVAEAFIDTVYIYSKDRVEIVFTFDDLLQRGEKYITTSNFQICKY